MRGAPTFSPPSICSIVSCLPSYRTVPDWTRLSNLTKIDASSMIELQSDLILREGQIFTSSIGNVTTRQVAKRSTPARHTKNIERISWRLLEQVGYFQGSDTPGHLEAGVIGENRNNIAIRTEYQGSDSGRKPKSYLQWPVVPTPPLAGLLAIRSLPTNNSRPSANPTNR